jgi:hypothetical protein
MLATDQVQLFLYHGYIFVVVITKNTASDKIIFTFHEKNDRSGLSFTHQQQYTLIIINYNAQHKKKRFCDQHII